MDNNKKTKIACAAAVNAVLLIVLMLVVVVYQIIEISVLSAKKKKLVSEYQAITQKVQESEDWLDYYENHDEEIMYILALQNGYGIKK